MCSKAEVGGRADSCCGWWRRWRRRRRDLYYSHTEAAEDANQRYDGGPDVYRHLKVMLGWRLGGAIPNSGTTDPVRTKDTDRSGPDSLVS